MRTLLVLAALGVSLVALAPTASAHGGCTFYLGPTGNGGVVWDTVDFAIVTGYSATCGLGYFLADGTCHFLVGGTCPL